MNINDSCSVEECNCVGKSTKAKMQFEHFGGGVCKTKLGAYISEFPIIHFEKVCGSVSRGVFLYRR